jgi:protein gp37
VKSPSGTQWPGINWAIVGAESGPGARPMEEAWVRTLRDQCVAAGVPFFYKQRAERGRKIPTPELDGRTWMEFPGGAR